jgi:hypothetical protein
MIRKQRSQYKKKAPDVGTKRKGPDFIETYTGDL